MPLFLVLPLLLLAQQNEVRPDLPPHKESVVVTGAFEPVPLEEADRDVSLQTITPAGRLLIATPFDLLRFDSSVDVCARAPNGVQTDVSVRGASFGQTLVLLNGLRFNDAQTGHHNFDLPLPLESIDRLEILKGSGSMFYGSDAVGGVVNVIPRAPEATELRLRSGFGNFGTNQQSGVLSILFPDLSQQFAFSRDFSTGFAPDRDYRNLSLSSETRLRTRLGATDVLLATADRPFGADQFYGNFNSWERTRTWFASARQELGAHFETAFGYRRHTDLFVLYRDRPQVFTNRHEDKSWQAAFRGWQPLATAVRLYYGVEGFRDAIASSNLGVHSRARGAAYAAFDARALRRFSVTAGAREEFFGAGHVQMSPTLAGSVWLTSALKLRASASRAFRLPSYTELYYQDPANVGSPGLQPEKAASFDAGLVWSPAPRFRAEGTVFQRRERDGIDYIRRSPSDIWRAANFQRLNFTGAEAGAMLRIARDQTFELRYTAMRGARDVSDVIYSKYTFNYPSQNAVVGWTGSLPGGIVARTRVGILNRRARDPYALWDASFASTRGRLRPFIQLSNLWDTRYEEIPGVHMPGRAVVGGVEWTVFQRSH